MSSFRLLTLALIVVLPVVAPASLSAQTPPAPRAPAAPPEPVPPPAAQEPQGPSRPNDDPFADLRRRPDWELRQIRQLPSEIRIGQPLRVGPNTEAYEVFVLGGPAVIEGRVARDVVVIFGDVELGSEAVVGGTLTVLSGNLTIRDGAQVDRDLVVIAGTMTAGPSFVPKGDHFVLDPNAFGGWMRSVIDWVSRGLLWGRLIVPSLPWMWGVVGVVFLLSLVLSLLLDKPVLAATETLGERPLTASLVGLLVLVLAGPVCVLLAVSVIGLAVVPFVLCALVLAMIVGKIAVTRRLGRGIVAEGDPASRAGAIRSFVIGFALIAMAYMVPLLGVITWTLTSVFGIGAAALAFMAAYRRENPIPVVAPRPVAMAAAGVPIQIPAPVFVEPPRPASEGFDAVMSSGAPDGTYPGALLNFPKASFRDRLAAGVLDVILIIFTAAVFDDFLQDSAIFLVALAYFVGFWAWKGTTVGGIILQLRVVRADGAPLGFAEALVRGLSSVFSAIVVGLGFLWILKDPERQAWQDKIAGTYVVKVPRNWPI